MFVKVLPLQQRHALSLSWDYFSILSYVIKEGCLLKNGLHLVEKDHQKYGHSFPSDSLQVLVVYGGDSLMSVSLRSLQ